jgi:hypothetical protein
MRNSARALSTVARGFNRPTTPSIFPWRFVSSLSGKGKNRSRRLPGAKTVPKSNDSGKTPTTVTGASFKVSLRPTMPVSDANRRFHSRLLNSTALGPFHLHSSALNGLPKMG